MKTAAALAFVASLLVACSAAQPSPSPTREGSPTPAASGSPAPPDSTPAPTSSPTPTAPPDAADARFEWGEPVEMTGLGGHWPERPIVAHANGTYVMVEGTRIWVSSDATAWASADSPVREDSMIELNGLVTSGLGFMIVGTESIDADDDGSPEDSAAVVLSSTDGRRWERQADWRFAHAAMNSVARSRQGIVVFGSTRGAGPSIWTSTDGAAWLKATNETGLEVSRGVTALAEHDGRLTAFVSHQGPGDFDYGPVDVWQTEGRADWQKVGSLPEANALVIRATFGGGRWLALGITPPDGDAPGADAWTSIDGRVWTRVTVPDEVHGAIAGWDDGMIAASHTGSGPGETCGGSGPFIGRSLISMDGGDWLTVPPTDGAAASALFVVDDQVVAIGLSLEADGNVIPVRWLAPLPRAVAVPAPTPTPTPAPTSEGCGG